MSNSLSLIRRRENRRSVRPPGQWGCGEEEGGGKPAAPSAADRLKQHRAALKADAGRALWSQLGGKLYYAQSFLDQGHEFSALTILKLLLSLRAASSFWSIIYDCDEVYNYWEPLHLLIFGRGFQTWEYSPEYGIRSWAYVLVHGAAARLVAPLAGPSKVMLFHLVRIEVALLSLLADFLLYRSVCRRLGNAVGSFFLALCASSVGMFNASAAFLPSAFAMALNALATAFYLRERWLPATLCTALAALLGWPFAAALGLPVAAEMLLLRPRQLALRFAAYAALSALLVLAPMYLIDSFYYGKPVLAPLNIVLYNVFSGHGPDLYGVEPASYYVKNLFLNWNIAIFLAPISLPSALLVYVYKSKSCDEKVPQIAPTLAYWYRFVPVLLIYLTTCLWLLVFFLQPHKEERFLFPIYPLIALLAAVALESLTHYVPRFHPTANLLVVLFVLLSMSRGLALYRNYSASADTFKHFHDYFLIKQDQLDLSHVQGNVRLCVGREWYRFPSSFFLPERVVDRNGVARSVELQFLRSNFDGILPKHFAEGPLPNVTSQLPTQMNDLNREEPARYVPVHSCHYVIDLFTGEYAARDAFNADSEKDYRVVFEKPFLLAEQSHPLFRAFYVPFTSDYLHFAPYRIYERIP